MIHCYRLTKKIPTVGKKTIAAYNLIRKYRLADFSRDTFVQIVQQDLHYTTKAAYSVFLQLHHIGALEHSRSY